MRHAILLSLALVMPLAAQQPPPGGPGGQMQPYDAAKEETLKLTVTEVATRERPNMVMVILTAKSGDKTYTVMAGTADFLKSKNVAFAKDDQVIVKGMVNETPNGMRVRAREITKGATTIQLLGKDGRPAWAPAAPAGGAQK
jgi:DNA/RNA endonuclease YhcR with UshA esterase domain